jgi:hypothetical protein
VSTASGWIACVVGLGAAALISALLALPLDGIGCGGSASRHVAAIGAAILTIAFLASVALRRCPEGSSWILLLTTAAASGHGALIAVKPSDLCPPCLGVFVLELVALAGAFLCRSPGGRVALIRTVAVAFVTAGLGAFGLGAVVEAGQRVEVLDPVEIASTASPRDRLTLHVILKTGCPRCEDYKARDHPAVVRALPPGSEVRLHEERMPGQFEPRSLPCVILTAGDSSRPIARLDGVRSADRVIDAIRRVEAALDSPRQESRVAVMGGAQSRP